MLAIELLTIAAPASLSSVIPEVSFHASSTNCLATVCLLAIVHSTHKRTFQSSSLLSMWLLAGIVCDSTRARLCSSFPYNVHIVALGHVGAALKVGLLTLEELPKLRYIKDANVRRATRWQSTCGLLTRNLIVYPYEELSLGFRNVNSFRQLEFLDPDFSARRLYRQYLAHWLSGQCFIIPSSQFTIIYQYILTCISWQDIAVLFNVYLRNYSLVFDHEYCSQLRFVCYLSFLTASIYLLCRLLFGEHGENTTGRVPYYFRNAHHFPRENCRYSSSTIFFLALLIYNLKITKAARTYSEGRLIVSFRAMLINAIYEKSLRRLEPQHKDFSTRNLIDTNLEAAANSIQSIFVSFKAAFTISAWVFILILIHGKVSIFMLLPCLCKSKF